MLLLEDTFMRSLSASLVANNVAAFRDNRVKQFVDRVQHNLCIIPKI